MNINSPLVSVCILTKNAGKIFESVLSAVLQQKTNFLYEIIVIDSGSTDGTLEYINSNPSNKLKVFTIKPEEFGHGKTRNLAIKKSCGQFIAMITHDAKPANELWLQNLISPFFTDEQVAGVFGRHYAYNDASLFTKRDLNIHFDNFKKGPSIVSLDDPKRYKSDISYRQYLHFFSDNNAALRRSIWERYPYPDVDFSEDQLWAKNIIEAGFKKAYADDAIVYHSHNYSLKNLFQRSYDESRALKRLFGYKLCPTILNLIYQVFACSRRDIKFYRESRDKDSSFNIIYIFTMHFLKQSGYYLGDKFHSSRLIFKLVSLDDSIKRNS